MKERKTAEKLMAKLNADSDYQARISELENERSKFHEKRAEQMAPVLAALMKEGIKVNAVHELNGGNFDEKVISILFDQIKIGYPDHVREEILRVLVIPLVRVRWGELLDMFENNSINLSSDIRYMAAYAISQVAGDDQLEDVIGLVTNRKFGFDRAPLIMPLMNSKSPKARMTLLKLRDDPDIGGEITKIRRLKRSMKSKKSD